MKREKISNSSIACDCADVSKTEVTKEKGSAGNQRKNNNVKMLTSNFNKSSAGPIEMNRSNSISRKSGASNSSMAVTHSNHESVNQKKGKTMRPVPRQQKNTNQTDSKMDKQGKASTEKPTTAQLEKAKLAEEIKLNVAALGMDMPISVSEAPPIISKVNNLVKINSPEPLNLKDADSGGDEADNETSPIHQASALLIENKDSPYMKKSSQMNSAEGSEIGGSPS